MNGQWIFTEHAHGDRWGGLGLRSAGGISASEWFNLSGGAALLLVPDGKWNEGGRWHLYYIAPGTTQPVNVDHLLKEVDPVYRRNPVHWAEVESRCVELINHLLGDVINYADIVEGYREGVALRNRSSEGDGADEEAEQPSGE
ncbi:hypothetical protein [Enemella sp. A6]|uniref:hypothetical protein n=1 Tax=Enemella sp. A6 TaxID=3440152 RepID=UPI003EB9DC52